MNSFLPKVDRFTVLSVSMDKHVILTNFLIKCLGKFISVMDLMLSDELMIRTSTLGDEMVSRELCQEGTNSDCWYQSSSGGG